jgi:carbon monoxide dehydrogenase subunit G
MARPILVSMVIPAPLQAVWDEIALVERHVEWMADAVKMEFLSTQHRGVGTRMKVWTKVGPLRTADVMEFTAWEPPHRMAIAHKGLVQGIGEFRLEANGLTATRFSWREELRFPWYLGGPITAFFARPVLGWIWRRNLARLGARFS